MATTGRRGRTMWGWRGWMILAVLLAGVRPAAAGFVEFESGQVRPLALSPDGTKLFAVNTPDNRLEVFNVVAGSLVHADSVSVGMEPVAVAARNDTEVWVVNHLSDSVSIVDVSAQPVRVLRTLLVGDEPRDVVFAGPGRNRAFITTAHRGQNSPVNAQLITSGVGRADVWVFDANNLGSSLGGTSLTILTLFGDTPRALAVSPDGGTVYAAVFHSGNQTTTVNEGAVCNTSSTNLSNNIVEGTCSVSGVTMPGGLPLPHRNGAGDVRPEVGLIVKFSGGHWVDQLGRNWDNAVKFTLPDKDVFAIDANANPAPVQTAFFAGVGTILFNMATNPVSGKVYVTNGESKNDVRFEGPGVVGGSTVQGHLIEYRITILDGTNVLARHLNKHINYSVRPAPAGVKDSSLATPLGMAITSNGQTLYVAAFGSSTVGVFDTAQLENNTFTPSASSHIAVNGGGPSGLILDEANHRLYVLTRFDNGIAVVDTDSRTEIDHPSLYNPEPASVVNGRRFLYDAYFTSSNGEASCSSCHIFGDLDSLAWDLGNPDDVKIPNPLPIKLKNVIQAQGGSTVDFNFFHPMKGPMTTQTLRGMVNHGAMHWRGDRADQGGDVFNSDIAFRNFRVAFPGLVGRDSQIPESDMQAFADFALQVMLPPNPIRGLDNSLTSDQQAGRNFMTGSRRADGLPVDVIPGGQNGFNCVGCHTLDAANGHFGGDGQASFENETQIVKVAHLRNLYQKVGMFGMPAVTFFNSGDNGFKGDQIRGFGFLHDGSVDTVFRFLQATVFNSANLNTTGFSGGDTQRRQVEQFLLAFDSDFAPIVGQQVTLSNLNPGVAGPRIDLLIARANTAFVLKGNASAKECDLTVKGSIGGLARGWVRTVAGTFQSDRTAETPLSDAQLRALASTPGQELTYTCVPPGSGQRIGIDRDEDGYFDRDEIDAGSDPANPASIPGASTATPTATRTPTATGTPADTATNTATATPSVTSTPADTPTATGTITATPTQTATNTSTNSPTPTLTGTQPPTNTPVNTPSATPTHTMTRTSTPTSTATDTPANTATATATNTAVDTPTPSATLTPTHTATETPTATPTALVSCTNGSLIDKAKFKLLRDLDPSGDEVLAISGQWQLAPPTPQINPISNGFRFAVYDKNGDLLYSRVIPPGAPVAIGAPGWRVNNRVTRWTFSDPSGTVAGGITRLAIRDISSGTKPHFFTFRVRGKQSDFQVTVPEAPPRIVIVPGGPTQGDAGQCASRAFNPSGGASPACKFFRSGNVLSCK